MSIGETKPKVHDSPNFRDVDQSGNPAGHVNYLDTLAANFPYKREALLGLNLRPGDRVLDVGCGTGDDARALAEIVGPTGEVVGLDASQTMIAEAEHRSEGFSLPVRFQLGDVEHLPFPDAYFDATRADRVLQHVGDPVQSIRELKRVTKSGGMINVLDPDWSTLVIDVPDRALWHRILGHYLEYRSHRRLGSQLFRLFHEAALTDIAISGCFASASNNITLVKQMANFSGMAIDAHADGLLTTDELAAWTNMLDDMDDGRPTTASIVVFSVRGIKP